ncbi:unnamed protein product [Clavelina lepadiformis]|uniref:GPS domain-containing protein n=1 Tax=Clavelina lepadiformis TaxID=159417 RepID=A0ABP0FW88_CLALP
MLKEVFIVTCIFMQISLSYQRRLDTDFEIKSANTNSSIAVCSGSLSTSFCAVARCPKFINITVNPRCVIEIKMPPQIKRCQNWTFSWTMKKAVGRCILEIICDSIHGKVKTALCSCSCFAEPAVDDLSTIALSTEMAATISASAVTPIHSDINKTAPVVYSTIKTLKSTSDMAAFLPQMTTAASTAAVTNYASRKTTTEVTFAKATEITSTLPVFATMAKNSTATTTSYLQDLEKILVKMKKMMSCSCSETSNGIDCQKCRKGKRKLIANQLREFENVLKNTSLQLIDTGNRIASTEHVQLIALREHCLNSSFSYGVAEIPLNEYEVTCNYSTQSNKLINGCLDYVVITAEVYIDSSIMSYLKDDPEQENSWSSHETHYIVPQSIPYLSVSTVEIRALNKLNGTVRYQLNSSIAKVIQDQVVPYVYHNQQGKRIYVKDITVSCDFIDERESEFSTFGCKRVDHNKFGPVVCECNHTTVFAILLSVESVAVPAGVKVSYWLFLSVS